MSHYILQRLLGMLVVMFVVVTIVFIIVRIAPGDPAAVMLGPDATALDVATLRTRGRRGGCRHTAGKPADRP